MNRLVIHFSRILTAVFAVVLTVMMSSCEKVKITTANVDPNTAWSFSTDIQPIFTSKCISCHGGTRTPDLREGKSYASLSNGGFVTKPAESSILYSTMSGSEHASRSTDEQKLKVLYWITQGAKNN
jgi:hypothetical protein